MIFPGDIATFSAEARAHVRWMHIRRDSVDLRSRMPAAQPGEPMLVLANVATNVETKWGCDFLVVCGGRIGWVLDINDVEIELISTMKPFVSAAEWERGE